MSSTVHFRHPDEKKSGCGLPLGEAVKAVRDVSRVNCGRCQGSAVYKAAVEEMAKLRETVRKSPPPSRRKPLSEMTVHLCQNHGDRSTVCGKSIDPRDKEMRFSLGTGPVSCEECKVHPLYVARLEDPDAGIMQPVPEVPDVFSQGSLQAPDGSHLPPQLAQALGAAGSSTQRDLPVGDAIVFAIQQGTLQLVQAIEKVKSAMTRPTTERLLESLLSVLETMSPGQFQQLRIAVAGEVSRRLGSSTLVPSAPSVSPSTSRQHRSELSLPMLCEETGWKRLVDIEFRPDSTLEDLRRRAVDAVLLDLRKTGERLPGEMLDPMNWRFYYGGSPVGALGGYGRLHVVQFDVSRLEMRLRARE